VRITGTKNQVPIRRIAKVVLIIAILYWRRTNNKQRDAFDTHFNVAMVGFKCRNFVRLQGLSNAAYNGKLARVVSLVAHETTGKYRVELQVDDDVAVASQLSRDLLFVKPENMMRACDCCHLAGAVTMQYCGRCRNAAYCNAECQRSDWLRHKVICSQMNSVRQLVKSPLLLAATMGNLA
jgi:hypothetical protein